MSHWQTYPDFAHLLTALLNANSISPRSLAKEYDRATGRYISHTKLESIAAGFIQPPYQVIADIADHALLSLDPTLLTTSNNAHSPGNYRSALFASAGLIEVSPESIAHWNEEVIAGWQRRQSQPGRTPLTWQELMKKLIEFHLQGERLHYDDIALAANAHLDPARPLTGLRLNRMLNGSHTASERERAALATVAGLSAAQVQFIEDALENGTLQLAQKKNISPFASRLGELLDRLSECKITQQQLSFRSIPEGQSEPLVSASTLSTWRNGRAGPTLATMRGLIRALERCGPVITQDDIEQLRSSSGFATRELLATTHDVIDAIDAGTRIKPLLAAIRNAADIDLPVTAIADRCATANSNPSGSLPLVHKMQAWENESSPKIVSETELRELLNTYNVILRESGRPELIEEEIQRVMAVAERDRAEGLRRGLVQIARDHNPPSARRKITPDFESGPSRG